MSAAGGRPPRRMLPSVTDVVNELARSVQADPAVLFKVSRQVVAEELGRVKQGFESASIEILAKRARRLLDPSTAGEPPAARAPAPEQPSLFHVPDPSLPARDPGPSSFAAPAAPLEVPPPTSSDEPFAAASEMDLGWEKDLPIQADDAPFRSAILPIPRSRMPAGIAALDAGAPEAGAPASKPAAPPAAPVFPLSSPEPVPAVEFELADEPEPATAAASPPAPPPAPPAARAAPSPGPADLSPSALQPDAASFLRAPVPAVPSAPPPMRSDERTAFIRSDTRPAFEPPTSPDARQAIRPPEEAGQRSPSRITTREWKALGDIGVATERLAGPAPAPAVARESARPAPALPRPPSGRGRMIAALAILLLVAGAAWFLRDTLFGRPATKPENPVATHVPRAKAEAPTAVPALPTPAPTAAAAKPAPVTHAASAGKSGSTKGSLMISKEWSGKPAVWVIHFSSHKDRAGAEKEAARLGTSLGKPGHAIEVDLGEKGIWYRVVIGEFATPEEAHAYHDELAAKNTPNMGFVYQLKGE